MKYSDLVLKHFQKKGNLGEWDLAPLPNISTRKSEIKYSSDGWIISFYENLWGKIHNFILSLLNFIIIPI